MGTEVGVARGTKWVWSRLSATLHVLTVFFNLSTSLSFVSFSFENTLSGRKKSSGFSNPFIVEAAGNSDPLAGVGGVGGGSLDNGILTVNCNVSFP